MKSCAGDFEPTVETLLKRCAEMRQFVHRLDEQSPSLFWTRGMILDCWEDMVRIDPSATLPPRPDAKQLTTVSVVAGTIEAVSEWCDKRASDEPALRRTDDDFGRWTAPHSGQSSGEEQPEGDTAHGPDFRSVRWFDSEYSFTANQSAVVRVLWEAWEAGTPDVGDETLLSAVDEDAPPSRLRDVFRNNPAWNSMIVGRGPKGTHRLAPPNENLPAQEIPT